VKSSEFYRIYDDDELADELGLMYRSRDSLTFKSPEWDYYQDEIDDIRAEMARRDAAARAQQEAE